MGDPVYVHCPLITNEEHQKLSKRSGHSSYEDLLEQGFVTEAIVNFVALLGWSPQDNQEIFSLPELVKAFDYHHISKSPAVFDITKLRWMNGEYIKKMDPEEFYEKALPYMKQSSNETTTSANRRNGSDKNRDIPGYPGTDRLLRGSSGIRQRNVLPQEDEDQRGDISGSPQRSSSGSGSSGDYTNDPLFASLSAFVKEKGYKNGMYVAASYRCIRQADDTGRSN